MNMVELQPGLGLGVSKFRVVFVFETPAAFDSFVNSGWEFGANAMAAAKTKTEGGALAGAVTVSDGVKMIQLNEEGLIGGVSLSVAKFYKDEALDSTLLNQSKSGSLSKSKQRNGLSEFDPDPDPDSDFDPDFD